MAELSLASERPHPDVASSPGEWWQFDAWSPGEDLGLWVEFGWSPTHRSGWYLAVLTSPLGPVVLVVDPDITLPSLTPSLEFRAEGIWAQHVCETPFRHWTVGLEAFGVSLDHPDDAAGDQWGVRTPLGLDVEWESNELPTVIGDDGRSFDQPARVTGEVLIADRVVDFDGVGRRSRSWGMAATSAAPANPSGLHIPVRLDAASGERTVDLRLDLDGAWHAHRG